MNSSEFYFAKKILSEMLGAIRLMKERALIKIDNLFSKLKFIRNINYFELSI